MSDPFIRTVRGDVPVKSLGAFLPHEHLFTDLRGPLKPHYAEGDPLAVEQVVKPYLDAAQRAGVTALTECSTLGVGRNVAVLRHLADVTPIHLIAPTGVYKEGFIPADLLTLGIDALADRWVRDLIDGMDGTSSRAGFIKIALNDDGPTDLEVRNLQAAAQTSRRTGRGDRLSHHRRSSRSARAGNSGRCRSRSAPIHLGSRPNGEPNRSARRRGSARSLAGVRTRLALRGSMTRSCKRCWR